MFDHSWSWLLGLCPNAACTLVTRGFVIRFTTQREVIWGFMPLVLFLAVTWRLEKEHDSTVCSADTLKPILLIILDWFALSQTLSNHFSYVMKEHHQLEREQTPMIAVSLVSIRSRILVTDVETSRGATSYPDAVNDDKPITRLEPLVFFRNIFYRWCQRWNVQSVGPKER